MSSLRADTPQSASALITQTLAHFLRFLSSLSLSGRINHRAFSLNVATAVLAGKWVWAPLTLVQAPSTDDSDQDQDKDQSQPSPSSSSPLAPSRLLLQMLLQRMGDVAPTVRVRALTATSDLLTR